MERDASNPRLRGLSREAHFNLAVGADDSAGQKNVANSPQIPVKTVHSARADVGIGPYNQIGGTVRIRRKTFVFTFVCRSTSQALRASVPAPFGPSGHFPLIGESAPFGGALGLLYQSDFYFRYTKTGASVWMRRLSTENNSQKLAGRIDIPDKS